MRGVRRLPGLALRDRGIIHVSCQAAGRRRREPGGSISREIWWGRLGAHPHVTAKGDIAWILQGPTVVARRSTKRDEGHLRAAHRCRDAAPRAPFDLVQAGADARPLPPASPRLPRPRASLGRPSSSPRRRSASQRRTRDAPLRRCASQRRASSSLLRPSSAPCRTCASPRRSCASPRPTCASLHQLSASLRGACSSPRAPCASQRAP